MVQLNFDLWLPLPLSLSFLFSQSSTILQPVKGSTDCSMQNEHLFPEINDCSPLDESLRSFSFSPIFDHKSVYNALASYFHLFFHEFDVMQRVFFFFFNVILFLSLPPFCSPPKFRYNWQLVFSLRYSGSLLRRSFHIFPVICILNLTIDRTIDIIGS